MHYALYRKYRPMTFSEVAGQEHITKTLINQVRTSQLSHAYLFCGTRGTGKTSCAKILARAVNCLSPENGEPCNKCEVCKGILDGSIFDVMEIDAASNNGVENVRQIRDEIVYTPVKAKYKVYIIDEVHMLSTGAFNALLKTLEEPPAHVIFILATTEAHKIPATILSRCQRFDFRRLTVKMLAAQINKVLSLENRTADEKTVRLVATLADGSARDALSILEKVDETGSYEEAEALLGVIGRGKLCDIAESIATADIDSLYEFIDELYYSSKDLSVMINELISLFRDILAVKSSPQAERFLDKSEEDIKKLKNLAEKFSYEHIVYAMDTLFEAAQSFSRSPDKRAAAELCLVKTAKPSFSENNSTLLARIGILEDKLKTIEASGIPAENREARKITPVPVIKAENAEPPSEIKQSEEATEDKTTVIAEKPGEAQCIPPENETQLPDYEKNAKKEKEPSGTWQEFMTLKDLSDTVRPKNRALSTQLANYARAVYRSGELVILCDNDRDYKELNTPQNIAEITEALKKIKREGYSVKIVKGGVNDYVNKNDTYENAENSGFFEFK